MQHIGTDQKGGVQVESDREEGDILGEETYEGLLFRVWDCGGGFITPALH